MTTPAPTELMTLGRLHIPDERDHQFLISAMPPAQTSGLTHRYWWANGWWGNQGNLPHCVAFSWMHWVEDGPTTHSKTRTAGSGPLYVPSVIYDAAQQVDQWPGTDYEGTSVRAGAKVLRAKGVIQEYRWAFDVNTVIDALLHRGPVVVGTWWHQDMFWPKWDSKRGKSIVSATGAKVGGHAYLLNGVSTNLGLVRIKNSWGRNWGQRGHAWISFAHLDQLIRDGGEACLAVEIET